MAAVLLSLGYFIWRVILLLINSFNTATDGLSNPEVGVASLQNAFQRPGLSGSLGQLSAHLVSDGGHQLPDWGCHCLYSWHSTSFSLQPHVGIHVLGFTWCRYCMDYLVEFPDIRMDQCWPDQARIASSRVLSTSSAFRASSLRT